MQWTECGVKELYELPAAEPAFEVYTDAPQPAKTPAAALDPKTPKRAPAKPKMKLRKEFALEMSMEEGYAMLIATNKVQAAGDA